VPISCNHPAKWGLSICGSRFRVAPDAKWSLSILSSLWSMKLLFCNHPTNGGLSIMVYKIAALAYL
jgi:hypothetical protein